IATQEELDKLDEISKQKIEDAVEFAKNSPEPTIESAFEDIYAD
ncbi:MAG: pyruvate dehydrogenase, partial [Pseudoleptotrichia goodfellowii]|nr:pyruvate dehydrogenase [Pseudoleptotrichia goodfellowii]